MTNKQELINTIEKELTYYREWKSLLDWNFVGRDVDFGDFPKLSKYHTFNIFGVIKDLEWQLYMVTHLPDDINEDMILQFWDSFQNILDSTDFPLQTN